MDNNAQFPQQSIPQTQTPSTLPSKSHLPYIFVAAIVFLLIGLVGGYYLAARSNRSVSPISKASDVQTTSPTMQPISLSPTPNIMATPVPAQQSDAIIKSFPTYPGSVFKGKKDIGPCPTEHSGYFICGGITYTWLTTDTYSSVDSWFKSNAAQYSWKQTGGAGNSADDTAYLQEGYTNIKDGTALGLIIQAGPAQDQIPQPYKTSITVLIRTY